MALTTVQKWLIAAAIACVIAASVVVVVLWQLGIGVFGSTVGTGLTAGTTVVSDYNPCANDAKLTLESTIASWPGNAPVNTSTAYMSTSVNGETLMCLLNPTGNPKDSVVRQYNRGVALDYPITTIGMIPQARSCAAINEYTVAYVAIPSSGTLDYYTGSTTGGTVTNPGAYVRVDNFDPTKTISTTPLNPINNGDTPEFVYYRSGGDANGNLYVSWTNPTSTNSTVYTYPVVSGQLINLPTSQFSVLGQTIKCIDIQGNYMAVGCPDNNLVYTYQYVNSSWVQQGTALTIAVTHFGQTVRLSSDQLTLAVFGLNSTAGTVYLYTRSNVDSAFANVTGQLTTGDMNFGLSMVFIGTDQQLLIGQSEGVPQIVIPTTPIATDWTGITTPSNYTFLGGGIMTNAKSTYDSLVVFDATAPSLLKFTDCHT